MKQVTMAQNIVSYYTERNIHRIRTGLKNEKKKKLNLVNGLVLIQSYPPISVLSFVVLIDVIDIIFAKLNQEF